MWASSARKRKVCDEDGEMEEHLMRWRDKGKAHAMSTEEAEAKAVGEEPVLRGRLASGEGVNKAMRGGRWAYTVHLGQLMMILN